MSYAVYTTNGFILNHAPTGEASFLYSIYTKDFGLITAKAQSVRLLSSKLRFNLEDYSYALFSLVKGKEVWRITGVSDKQAPRTHVRMRARVLSLVRRLVQGEGNNKKLFHTLVFMMEKHFPDDVSSDEVVCFEVLVLMHVLSALGYLDTYALIGLPHDEYISLDQLGLVLLKKNELIGEINKAIKETQL